MKFIDVLKGQAISHTEVNPLRLGNVEFWFSGADFCYSPAVDKWNSRKIAEDLVSILGNKIVYVCKNCGDYTII